MKPQLIAVIGSRSDSHTKDESIKKLIRQIVQEHHPDTVWMSGGAASGPDFWIKSYCRKYRKRYVECLAFWDWKGSGYHNLRSVDYDKSAGLFRNETMSMLADFAYVLWDGKSKGTANMIENLRKHKVSHKIMLVEAPAHPLDNLELPKHPPVGTADKK